MAFASAITGQTYFGNKKIVFGTYTNAGGDTGGDIVTGLINCEGLFLQPKGAAVIANAAVVNETFPVAGGSITIVNTADEDGTWMAIGY
jgi:hypothetical protein